MENETTLDSWGEPMIPIGAMACTVQASNSGAMRVVLFEKPSNWSDICVYIHIYIYTYIYIYIHTYIYIYTHGGFLK